MAKESKLKQGEKNTITIKLMRGTMSCPADQRATVVGLGLKKREQVRTLVNTPAVRGMIKKVLHLVDVVSDN